MQEVAAQQGAAETQSVAGGSLPFPTLMDQWPGQRVQFPPTSHVEQALSGVGIKALGSQIDEVKPDVFPVLKAVFLFRLQERHGRE